MKKEIPFCPDPFMFLSRDQERFLSCCPSWMHESRFIYDSPDNLWDVWNHPKLVEWRECLLNGDYRYCQMCPNRFRERDRNHPLPHEKPIMEVPPVTFSFQDNMTCNLHCPSCRDHVVSAKRGHPYSPWKVCGDFPGLQTVAMSLAGDPFANKEHLRFLQEPGTPDVILWTNGILLPKYWHTLKRKVTVIVMSVDACQAATYEKLRRGATWDQVQHSLRYISDLVRSKAVELWQLNFVVQVDNYLEMPGFADMAKSLGVHIMQFTPIAPWPHISQEEWSRVNITNPQHPEHGAFLRVLQHPLLHQQGVDIGFVCDSALDIYAGMPAETDIWKRCAN